MLQKIKYFFLLVLCLAIGFGLGKYYTKPKVKIQTEEKIVEVVKKDVVIVEKVIEKPDGTKITERVVEESTESKKEEKNKNFYEETPKNSEYNFHVLYQFYPRIDYGISIQKNIIGPISLGVFGFVQSQTIGISIGFEF